MDIERVVSAIVLLEAETMSACLSGDLVASGAPEPGRLMT